MIKFLIKFLIDSIKTIFQIKCPKCKKGIMRDDRLEWIGRRWHTVYKCEKCGYEGVLK